MGKNQAYKAMQMARLSGPAGTEEVEDGMEEELKKGELEADKDRMMRDYRAQLDADRARKLAVGKNHSGMKLHHSKAKRDKDLKT